MKLPIDLFARYQTILAATYEYEILAVADLTTQHMETDSLPIVYPRLVKGMILEILIKHRIVYDCLKSITHSISNIISSKCCW